MKNNILRILLIAAVLIVFGTSPLICFAEENTEYPVLADTSERIQEGVPEESQEIISAEDQKENAESNARHTIFTRLWEYCVANRTELLGLTGDAVIFFLAVFVKVRNDKKTRIMAEDLKIVRVDTAGTISSQSSVVGAVNTMIDGYEKMKKSYEKYEDIEDDRNRLIGAVMVQNTALLEILTTVYVNNKNMPQGIKDVIMLKYANCMKTLNDDATLRDIVEAVREKTCSGTKSESEKVDGKADTPEQTEE